MAIDASIYNNLGAGVTPLMNPLDIQARKIAIRNALAAGTLQDQQIQAGQQALADDRATRAAARDYYTPGASPTTVAPPPAAPSGGALPFDPQTGMNPDPTGGASAAPPTSAAAATPPVAVPPAPPIPTMADLVRRGVPPAHASALIQQFQKIDETNATIQQTRANALKSQKEANDLVAQQASDMANSLVRTAVPGQPINPDLLNWNLQHFASLGPQEAAQAQQVGDHLATLAPADQITFLKTLAGTPKTSEANSRADDAQTAADRLATEKPKMIADGALAQLTAAGKAPIQPVDKARLGQEQQNINLRAQEFSLRTQEFNQKYGDAVGQLSPTNLAIAKKLAVGDFNPAQLGRLPGKEAIIAGAIALNPNWTPQTFETKESFTNPEKLQAKNLGTISRIVGHIGRFEKNSQSLGVAPLYGVAGVNFGGTAKSISEDAHAISAELEKLASGSVGAEGQIKLWQADLRSTLPAVRQRAVDEISHLVGSQYEGMAQTYKAGTGFDLPVKKFLTPDAQAWMKSKGINIDTSSESAPAAPGAPAAAPAGSIAVTDPQGGVHVFANQADAQNFKSLAGIK